MKGVILAAGKGSRLYPVTHLIAKPLLPLANRPTLHYAFDRLKGMGVTEICLVVGENEGQMNDALGDGSEFGVRLTYVRQPEPLGLAHAVKFTQEFVDGDSFVLYLGDAMYDRSFAEFARTFRESGCANLNIVKAVDDPTRFGVANVEGDRIVKLVEKPAQPESNLAMAGMYFFGPEIWKVLPDLSPSARGEYEITDAIQLMIDAGFDVRAGVYEGAWFDTGTLDSFLETSAFLIQDGMLIAPDAKVEGLVGPKTVVGEGAEVQCEAISDSVILPGARVQVNGKIHRAVLGGPISADTDVENTILHGDYEGA